MIPIKYNFRSLFVRKGTTLMTLGSIAFVVLVYIGVLALAGGMASAFSASGDASTVIVLRDGARSEMESGYPIETHRILTTMPGVLSGSDGAALASGETVTLMIHDRKDGTESNIVIRGVESAAFEIRPGLQITEGRNFEPGKAEVVVGSRLAERFAGMSIGDQLQLGRTTFRIVGHFDDGGALASEVWGPARDLGESFRRTNYFSSSRLKATSPAAARDLIATIESDQRLQVDALTEAQYFEEQTQQNAQIFVILGNVLAVLMAFGACFAAANTMYSQVSIRGREIGTLRALGFRRGSILASFLIEAVLLGLLAGALGAVLSLPLNAISTGTMNQATFSEVSFSLRTTPSAIFAGIFLATVTGVLGGALPSLSASRRPITSLLREA